MNINKPHSSQDMHYDNQFQPQNRSMNSQQQQKDGQYEDRTSQILQELQVIQGQKIRSLEQNLMEKENIIQQMNEKCISIQENFNYNLQVLDSKENDIAELSSKMRELKQICDEKNMKITELENDKTEAIKAQDQIKDRMGEKNRSLYDKIEELKQEVKFYKNNYNQELQKHKEATSHLNSIDQNNKEVEQRIRKEYENNIAQIKQNHQSEIIRLEQLMEQAKQQRIQQTNDIQSQNERLLKQNEELLSERVELKSQLIERERAQAQEIYERNARVQEALTLAQHAQQEAQNLKQANNGWDVVMREKLQIAQSEKEDLLQTLNQYKQKSKQKIQGIREEGERRFEELIRENSARVKRLSQEQRDLQQQNDYLSLSEKNLKDRYQEILSSHRREVEDLEHKNNIQLKNMEEDKRHLRNEIQIKEFQNNQLSDDYQRELKKTFQIEEEYKILQNQINQLEKENTMILEELVLFRKHFPNAIFSGHQTTNKQNFHHQSPFKKERNVNPHKQHIEATGQKDESFEKLFSEDMGYVNLKSSLMGNHLNFQDNRNIIENRSQPLEQFQRIKELEFDVKTYKDLIDDMTKEMEKVKQKVSQYFQDLQQIKNIQNSKNNLEFNNQELRISKEECIELRNRASEYKLDIVSQKEKLQKYEFENKELNKDIVERKTFEQIQQTLKLQDVTIETIKQKCKKLQREIQDLKRERDSLSEISANLKSKCIDYEERLEIQQYGDRGIDPQQLRAQNEVYFKQLHQMQQQLQQCEEELKKWQKIDTDKQLIIEQLKDELIQNNKLFKQKSIPALSVVSHYNHMKRQEAIKKQNQQQQNVFKNIPKYDQFEEIDEVPVKLNYTSNFNNNQSPQKQQQPSQDNNTLLKNKIQKAEQNFKKELVQLYDHINPDSAQFIQGHVQQNI